MTEEQIGKLIAVAERIATSLSWVCLWLFMIMMNTCHGGK